MLRSSVAVRSTGNVAGSAFNYCVERLNPGIGRSHNLMLDRGEGSYVYDADGRRYLDFVCGIGVTNLGHCHPRLVAAARAQLDKAWHLQVCTGPHTAMKRLLEQLERVFPAPLNNFSFVTTGAEAVEAALKLSRAVNPGRPVTAVLQGGYHGRTVASSAMTSSKCVYSRGLKPLMPGVVVLPVPYSSQLKVDPKTPTEAMVTMALDQAKDALFQQAHPSEVSMLIAEPLLGEGGYLPLPKAYYKGLRDFCSEHGILFVMDEVQSGFARTGTNFMFEQLTNGSTDPRELPDCVVFAKGIANGLPIAGIVTRKELAAKQLPGQQGGTYAGNPVACATAAEVMDVLRDERILDNVAERSEQLSQGLKALSAETKAPVMEIRGRGLMIGLQFDLNCPAGMAAQVSAACEKRGLLLLNTSKFETLRFIPPLNVSESEVEDALVAFREALAEVVDATRMRTASAPRFQPCCEGAAMCCPSRGPCRLIAVRDETL